MRISILLSFWVSMLNASSLTVCGISDGGAGDTDGVVNGSISAQCSFSGGLFSGTVTEGAVPMTYFVTTRGIFQGSGSFDITGIYDITPGTGQFYPYFSGCGSLASLTPGGVFEPGGHIRFGDADAHAGPVSSLLPTPVCGGGGGDFSFPVLAGPQAYSITVTWSAGGPGRYFEFAAGGPFGGASLVLSVSTDPLAPIPEPSMAPVVSAALLVLLAARTARAKWHT